MHPMPKCPYCKSEVHIEDFFDNIAYSMGKNAIKRANFKGESIVYQFRYRMWVCPSCDTILGFTGG